MIECKEYGLNCLKCPYWNYYSNYCTKYKIWSETHMTAKRYDVIDKEEPRGQSVTYDGIPCTARTCVTRLNRLTEENEQLKKELDYIQNSITEHIKHQKTELGQKALKEIIADYNEWMLGHKELEE